MFTAVLQMLQDEPLSEPRRTKLAQHSTRQLSCPTRAERLSPGLKLEAFPRIHSPGSVSVVIGEFGDSVGSRVVGLTTTVGSSSCSLAVSIRVAPKRERARGRWATLLESVFSDDDTCILRIERQILLKYLPSRIN